MSHRFTVVAPEVTYGVKRALPFLALINQTPYHVEDDVGTMLGDMLVAERFDVLYVKVMLNELKPEPLTEIMTMY